MPENIAKWTKLWNIQYCLTTKCPGDFTHEFTRSGLKSPRKQGYTKSTEKCLRITGQNVQNYETFSTQYFNAKCPGDFTHEFPRRD